MQAGLIIKAGWLLFASCFIAHTAMAGAGHEHHSAPALHAIAEPAPLQADTSTVTVIKPLALIYLALMPTDTPAPVILVPEAANPHDFALSVSQLKSVQKADVILWMGSKQEPFMDGLQQRFSGTQQTWVAVSDTPHTWLTPDGIVEISEQLAAALSAQYPQWAVTIRSRQQQLQQQVAQLFAASRQQLAPYADTPFLLGHSAFAEFAQALGLAGAVYYQAGHSHGDSPMGMQTMLQVQQRLARAQIHCAIEEPDISFAKLAQRYPSLKRVMLSPLAQGVALNDHGFVQFLEQSVARLQQCLANSPSVAD